MQVEARHAAGRADARARCPACPTRSSPPAGETSRPAGRPRCRSRPDASRDRPAPAPASASGSNCSLACFVAASWMLRSRVCRVAFSPSMYWASSWARSGRSVTSSSTASCGWPEPAGGVQPRGQGESPGPRRPAHLVVGCRSNFGDVHQRGQPERRAVGQALQPVTDQHAILVDQRHHVGHGAQRGQPDRLQQKILHPRRRPFAPRWPAGRAPRPASTPRPSRSGRRTDSRRRAAADGRWPRPRAVAGPARDGR